MKYSFIIPMYNEINDISLTVESCLSQRHDGFDYEIVLIDDGSTDGTYEYCKQQYEQLSNLKLIRNTQNEGVSSTRNIGVSNSQGDVIIFLNADEIVETDFLCRIDSHYQKGADYVFPLSRVKNKDKLYGSFRDCYRLAKYYRPNLFMWSQGFSCRKDAFLRVNGFDTRYPGCGGEDWDFVSKLDMLSFNRVVDLNIVVYHTVPEKCRDVIWHIYNRGRGSSYYDLIYKKTNPNVYVLNNVMMLLVLLGLGWFITWWMPLIYILLCFCKVINDANRIRKKYETPRISIIAVYILEKGIRKIGYDINMLNHIFRKTTYA